MRINTIISNGLSLFLLILLPHLVDSIGNICLPCHNNMMNKVCPSEFMRSYFLQRLLFQLSLLISRALLHRSAQLF